MNRIREAPATIKILLIAIVLILLPGAVLSYVGYMSVNERARQPEAGYRGTLFLVRDRIELEVLRLEQGLRSSVDNAATNLDNLSASRHLFQLVATNNPWLRRPFLASPAGDLIAGAMSIRSPKPPGTIAPPPSLSKVLTAAEAAEFAHKDPVSALQLYLQVLEKARSAEERAILLLGRVVPDWIAHKCAFEEHPHG